MTASPPTEGKQFRSSVLSMFIFMLALGLPVTFCLLLAIYSGIPVPVTLGLILHILTFIGGALPIFLLIGAWMLSTFCPTTIFTDGVTTQSFMGDERFVRWQDIGRARTLRFLNLKWILVYPAGESKALQVPLFQPRKAEFIQEIQRLAPPGNPILNQLQ
ncbi:MAG TPA: hypothetical protein VNL17_15900 [Verrucomicrobiae bacterium]|nr:hypothetical protein [Verrucomicrobiae bacterium]